MRCRDRWRVSCDDIDVRLKCFVVAGALALAALPASAAPITLINQGFEDSLNGWAVLGEANAVRFANIDPGNLKWFIEAAEFGMAQVDTGDSPTAEIETFLEITGSLDEAFEAALALACLDMPSECEDLESFPTLAGGSAIYQDFNGADGDTLTQYWNFVTRDYWDYNDLAMAVVVPPTGPMEIVVLASIWAGGVQVGDEGTSGWLPFNYTLSEGGAHRIAFIAMNSNDDDVDSVLFLDNGAGAMVNLTLLDPPRLLPEPGTLVAVGLGLAVIAVKLRRRR